MNSPDREKLTSMMIAATPTYSVSPHAKTLMTLSQLNVSEMHVVRLFVTPSTMMTVCSFTAMIHFLPEGAPGEFTLMKEGNSGGRNVKLFGCSMKTTVS
jgi:hypothetical protein